MLFPALHTTHVIPPEALKANNEVRQSHIIIQAIECLFQCCSMLFPILQGVEPKPVCQLAAR